MKDRLGEQKAKIVNLRKKKGGKRKITQIGIDRGQKIIGELPLTISLHQTQSKASVLPQSPTLNKPLSQLINRPSKMSRQKSSVFFTEQDALKEQFYIVRLFRNFEAAKHKMKKLNFSLQPIQRYTNHCVSRQKIPKSKSASRKIRPGCLPKDQNESSPRNTLKFRLRLLSMESSGCEQVSRACIL